MGKDDAAQRFVFQKSAVSDAYDCAEMVLFVFVVLRWFYKK
jgi:hypothetical protein